MENVINTTVNTTPVEAETEKMSVLDIVLAARYFAPLASGLGFLLGFSFGSNPIVEVVSLILIAIGLLAAVTVCPLKLLAFPIKCAGKGFTICRGFIPFYGVADLVAAVVGVSLGFLFGACVVLFAPAFFTIKKFLIQAEE